VSFSSSSKTILGFTSIAIVEAATDVPPLHADNVSVTITANTKVTNFLIFFFLSVFRSSLY